MSVFSAMTTAVSGLNAQSKALGAISDNVANSQTIGFKRVDTTFQNLVTASSQSSHSPGTVLALPQYRNSQQGGIEAVESDTGLAVAGQGFFPVRRPVGEQGGMPLFDGRQSYTRAGDFSVDRNNYLVNSAGYFLEGWPAQQDPTTGAVAVDRAATQPVRLAPLVLDPVATGNITFAANLPSDPPAGTTQFTSSADVYDPLGQVRKINLNWTKDTTANQWHLDVDAPGSTDPVANADSIQLDFSAGTLTKMTSTAVPAIIPAVAAQTAGQPAYVDLNVDYGNGPQTIRLQLGSFGATDGLTQFAGGAYEIRGQAQDGAPKGNYTSVAIGDNGDVRVNYDNGLSRTIARVPLATFANPDALQRTDGQAFTSTLESGAARVSEAGNGGAGKLLVGAIERSNVDIAAEFTKLIVAQRAYSANTRIVTASDEMLTETINMKR